MCGRDCNCIYMYTFMCIYIYIGKLYIMIKEWNNKYDNEIKLGHESFSYGNCESWVMYLRHNRRIPAEISLEINRISTLSWSLVFKLLIDVKMQHFIIKAY